MIVYKTWFLFSFILFLYLAACHNKDYIDKRKKLFHQDARTVVGCNIKLSDKEQKVNELLLKLKQKELQLAFMSGKTLQEQNFVLVRDAIAESDVFKVIRKMPKGAVLHVHDASLASFQRLIKWTYEKYCYMCYNSSADHMNFFFSLSKPSKQLNKACDWISVPEARLKSGSPEEFDAMLLRFMTLSKNDIKTLKDQNLLWKKFENIFSTVRELFTYYDAFRDYYYHALSEFVDDNIQYVEIRATLPLLYHLNGSVQNSSVDTLKTYIEVQKEFTEAHADDFFGAKYIFSGHRASSKHDVERKVLEALSMYEQYPKYFAGFDLVGQEDAGHSLLYFLDELLLPAKLGRKLPYVFHAGETNLEGASVDDNLFDAFLLNTTRLGHGFALVKHSFLKDEFKRLNLSIELCPISNQMLGLVDDLRNHPATVLLGEDQPITVSPDDPAIWGATGVTYDMYQVFMGMTPVHSGLDALKALTLNSIRYSSLDKIEKHQLMEMWKKKWNKFVDDIIAEYQL